MTPIDEVDNLVERLKAIPAGTKLTVNVEGYFGGIKEAKVTTCGEVRQHGYYAAGGGWGLYRIYAHEKECHEILIKPYRKQKKYWIPIGWKLKDYRLGW